MYSSRILFGTEPLNGLPAQPKPGKRALIVLSDGNPTRADGCLARTAGQLPRTGVATEAFDGIMPNPIHKYRWRALKI